MEFVSCSLLLLLLLLHSLHQLLLSYLSLLTYLVWHLLHILSPLRSVILPYDLEDFIRIIRSNWRFYVFVLQLYWNELLFLRSLWIQIEPVVQILTAESPSVGDSFSRVEFDGFDLIEHDEFWGGQREVVFADLDVSVGEGDALVFVEDLVRHWISNIV